MQVKIEILQVPMEEVREGFHQEKKKSEKKKVKLAWEATEVAWKVPLQMHLP